MRNLIRIWQQFSTREKRIIIVAFVIAEDSAGGLFINILSRCSYVPSLWPWGWVPCYAYSSSNQTTGFVAFYDHALEETWVMARQLVYAGYELLEVTDFHFYPGLYGPPDRMSHGIFVKIYFALM